MAFRDDSSSSVSTIKCDDFQECNGFSELINNNGSICCSAFFGCQGKKNISIIMDCGDSNNITTSNSATREIRCDSSYGCQDSNISINIIHSSNNNDDGDFDHFYSRIYSTGYYACQSCTISGALTSDIICSSRESCYLSQMTRIGDLYCLSLTSCREIDVL